MDLDDSIPYTPSRSRVPPANMRHSASPCKMKQALYAAPATSTSGGSAGCSTYRGRKVEDYLNVVAYLKVCFSECSLCLRVCACLSIRSAQDGEPPLSYDFTIGRGVLPSRMFLPYDLSNEEEVAYFTVRAGEWRYTRPFKLVDWIDLGVANEDTVVWAKNGVTDLPGIDRYTGMCGSYS